MYNSSLLLTVVALLLFASNNKSHVIIIKANKMAPPTSITAPPSSHRRETPPPPPPPSSTEWGIIARELSSSNNKKKIDISDDDDTDDNYWEEAIEDSITDTVDIAIIGAGPAGLATAIGLSRLLLLPPSPSGGGLLLKIRVYERAPSLRNTSQGMLSLWPNGMAYLDRIHPDLRSKVIDAGCPLENTVFVKIGNKDGEEGTITSRNSIKREPGTVLIRWHALQTVLASMLPNDDYGDDNNRMLITNHSLVSYKETKECVYLKFENGNIVKAKIVIGADGTFSSVRQTMFPNDKPIYFGQMNWNAIVPTSTLPPDARPPVNGVKVITYDGNVLGAGDTREEETIPRWSAFVNDCGAGHTFFQLRITDEEKARAISGSKGRGGFGLSGVKSALLPIVKVSTDLTQVFNAIPEEIIFERAIVGRLPVASTWTTGNGRVALLGDAAHGMHPMIGQGANCALGSAASLVESIVDCYNDDRDNNNGDDNNNNNNNNRWLVQGLQTYDTNRRPRVDWIHRLANMVGCSQASSSNAEDKEQFFDSKETSMAWFNWPRTSDDTPPPIKGRDVVKSFDPLSRPEVSLL